MKNMPTLKQVYSRILQEQTVPVSYTAIVLYKDEASKLREYVPDAWEAICHHCTVHMGAAKELSERELLGQEFTINVLGLAQNDLVSALRVEIPQEVMTCYAGKGVTHITLGVNRIAGGKPVMSNNLDWTQLQPVDVISLKGRLIEVPQGDNSYPVR